MRTEHSHLDFKGKQSVKRDSGKGECNWKRQGSPTVHNNITVRTNPSGHHCFRLLPLTSEVVNYLKSEPGGGRILVDFPGEFRLLGALWKPAVDVTPLDTAIRGRGLSKHFGMCVKKHFMTL